MKTIFIVLLLCVSLILGCFNIENNENNEAPSSAFIESVKEHDISIAFNEDGAMVFNLPIKVKKQGVAPLNLFLTNFKQEIVEGLEGRWNFYVTEGNQVLKVLLEDSNIDLAMIYDALLHYDLDGIKGRVAYFPLVPMLKTQVMATSTLLGGEGTIYRILTSDPIEKTAVTNTNIDIKLLLNNEELISASGVTNEFGIAQITVDAPL